jgi:hypothetical protein
MKMPKGDRKARNNHDSLLWDDQDIFAGNPDKRKTLASLSSFHALEFFDYS